MVVLIRMNNKAASPAFLSTSFMGELVSEDEHTIKLRSCCGVYEALNQKMVGKQVVNDIEVKYLTNSLISNGENVFRKADISIMREVDPTDEVMKGYVSSFEEFRLEKINIQKAKSNLVGMDRGNA